MTTPTTLFKAEEISAAVAKALEGWGWTQSEVIRDVSSIMSEVAKIPDIRYEALLKRQADKKRAAKRPRRLCPR